MPFKSEAQRRKFALMVEQGKISKDTFKEWDSKTPKKIPERVVKADKKTEPSLKKVGKVQKI